MRPTASPSSLSSSQPPPPRPSRTLKCKRSATSASRSNLVGQTSVWPLSLSSSLLDPSRRHLCHVLPLLGGEPASQMIPGTVGWSLVVEMVRGVSGATHAAPSTWSTLRSDHMLRLRPLGAGARRARVCSRPFSCTRGLTRSLSCLESSLQAACPLPQTLFSRSHCPLAPKDLYPKSRASRRRLKESGWVHGLLTTEDPQCELAAFSYTSIPGTH